MCIISTTDAGASACGEETVGESNFVVSFDLQDLEDSRSLYNMIGYKAAGEAIFGKKSATTVEDMNIEAVADIRLAPPYVMLLHRHPIGASLPLVRQRRAT